MRRAQSNTWCQKMNTAPRRPRRRVRHAPQPVTAMLRNLTSNIVHGVKTKGRNPHPVHVNRKKAIIEAFAKKTFWKLKRLRNKDFGQHFMGQETLYFTGNGSRRAFETLANIDIDCHNTGTLEGALGFAEHLREHHFPNLYYETSTNGNGVHAYVRIRKYLSYDYEVNEGLNRLQAKLQQILREQDFDVEMVEVKGHCPVMGWSEKPGEISKMSMGQLAKHPREALFRSQEFRETTVLRAFDLLRLPAPDRTESKQKGKRPPASISGCFLSEEEVAKTKTSYLRLAKILLDNHRLATSTKSVIEAEDIAVFIMFLKFFTLNMNKDGSLPWARFRNLWEAVRKSGDIDRAFQSNRFAVIRDYLSSLELIEWEDNTYKIGQKDSGGVRRGGKACKWKASQVLMDLIKKAEDLGSEDSIPVAESQDVGIDKGSLSITNILTIIQNLRRKPFHQTIRPVEIHAPPPLLLTADDIGKYLTPIEDIWTVAI